MIIDFIPVNESFNNKPILCYYHYKALKNLCKRFLSLFFSTYKRKSTEQLKKPKPLFKPFIKYQTNTLDVIIYLPIPQITPLTQEKRMDYFEYLLVCPTEPGWRLVLEKPHKHALSYAHPLSYCGLFL